MDYARGRAEEKEREVEKARRTVAAQILERQIQETARKDAVGY